MNKLLDEIYCEILEQDWMNGKAEENHDIGSTVKYGVWNVE